MPMKETTLGKLVGYDIPPEMDHSALTLNDGSYVILKTETEEGVPTRFNELLRQVPSSYVKLMARDLHHAKMYLIDHKENSSESPSGKIITFEENGQKTNIDFRDARELLKLFETYANYIYDPNDMTDSLSEKDPHSDLEREKALNHMDALPQLGTLPGFNPADYVLANPSITQDKDAVMKLGKLLGCHISNETYHLYILCDKDPASGLIHYQIRNQNGHLCRISEASASFNHRTKEIKIINELYYFKPEILQTLKKIDQDFQREARKFSLKGLLNNWKSLTQNTLFIQTNPNKIQMSPFRHLERKGQHVPLEECFLDLLETAPSRQKFKQMHPMNIRDILNNVLSRYPSFYEILFKEVYLPRENAHKTQMHETKHALNHTLKTNLLTRKKKSLSLKQHLLFDIHDERSAWMTEQLYIFNDYMKQQNDDILIDAVKTSSDLANYLLLKSPEERQKTTIDEILTVTDHQWKEDFQPIYDKIQFSTHLVGEAKKPAGEELEEQDFQNLLKEMFQFNVWNPKKQEYTPVNLYEKMNDFIMSPSEINMLRNSEQMRESRS